ncbi:MAG: hypothetical protein FVQ81_08440 [Candidatus Glassbacteria bacterium]|nr:hypothetical protein [Candidatus Glassbacteria bacterium]
MRFLSKGLFAALFLLVLISVSPAAQTVPVGQLRWMLVRVSPDNPPTARSLHSLGFEHLDQVDGGFEVVATELELELIRNFGLRAEVLDRDFGRTLVERNTQKSILAAAGSFATGSMAGYFNPDEILAFVDSLRNSTGDSLLGDTAVVGLSLQERPVWMVELGHERSEGAPEVFFNSLTHAREGMSVMALLYFIRYLVDNYAVNDSVRWLMDHRRIFCVPVVNPDGFEINWNLYDSGGGFGLWRKNARDNNGDGTLDNQDGVDLNRNFSYAWGYDNIGSDSTWYENDFRGDSAFSEPESRVMRDFISGRNFRVAINCHAYGNSLLKPWSYIAAETPDSAVFNRIGAKLVGGSGYVHGNATSILNYPANGEFTDWEYGDSAGGKIIAWTAEIGERSQGFWPPADQIEPIAQNVLPTLFAAARAAGFWPELEIVQVNEVPGFPRRRSILFRVDNVGLADTDRPFTITLGRESAGVSALRTVTVDTSAVYPRADSLLVEFGPEVYSLSGSLVVEQEGLTVTSYPLAVERPATDIAADLDGNGRTDIFDLLEILRVVSRGVPDGDDPARYDLNGDGRFDIFDLIDMLKRLRPRN